MVGRERTFGGIGSQPGNDEEGIARRIASSRSPREKALIAAKLTVAMLLAQFAFAAYADAQDCPTCPPAPCSFCPPAPTPLVVKTNPANEQTGVDRDANIRAKFLEKMDKSTINKKTIYLAEEGGSGVIPAKVSYNQKKKKVILDPKRRLKANTEYVATVEGARDGDEHHVEDRDGISMQEDYVWSFTTGRR